MKLLVHFVKTDEELDPIETSLLQQPCNMKFQIRITRNNLSTKKAENCSETVRLYQTSSGTNIQVQRSLPNPVKHLR